MASSRGQHVLHVVPYFEQAWGYGGIPRAATGMARGLVERGHRVTVLTTDACDATSRLGRPAPPIAEAAETTAGLAVRVFPNLSNRAAYRFQFFTPRGLDTFLSRHAGEFDVAHLHGCHHLLGALAARRLKRAGVPYVLTPNGTAGRIERRRFLKLLFDKSIGRGVLPGAARVLAVSAHESRALGALGVSADRLRIVANPLDLDEFEPAPPRGVLRARYGLGEAPLVLYLGTLSPRKGVATLAEAFGALSADVRLVVAGNDFGAGGALDRALRASGREKDAIVAGLLRGRERLEALADADVVAYPSRDEAFGLVPLEALLCGTPVVVCDDAGCGEVIAEIGGGLRVPPGDAPALAGALQRILAEPAAFRAQVPAAAARVRERFSRAVVAERLEEIYGEIVRMGQTRRTRAA